MAPWVIAYPAATFTALAVRVPQRAPLALPRRMTSPNAERSSIASRVMSDTARPRALKTAYRVLLPLLDACQSSRINPDVRFRVTTLEADTRIDILTTTLDVQDSGRMLDVPHFKDYTITDTKYIYVASSTEMTIAFLPRKIINSTLTGHA